ncbi:hypothetical protein EMIHUDRAFT_448523 [Emiliania huxleyi CCMP1516]|uniref:Tyrosinase copper-binding domain-containing protein n=2 Tax=Emiliania huxleyi TaxID=2903 RepID=A0A0D3I7I2_EMIH1|nr:hypothetical protein EMIHUDRAFT_448523 [Emiliania huxleyi CCMP1516]EOD07217.1 hypothetical protein EMIHUDRAFT_448523 [Emiliania huxleyi CCMP1516]|eukprot:XP_005759646.1 hypothetical protein EMIHUDRAFT_448523 [Emiliania huxleyi CCMP1516]
MAVGLLALAAIAAPTSTTARSPLFSSTPDPPLDARVVSSGAYHSDGLAEPYRDTVLSVCGIMAACTESGYTWKINFEPKPDEIWPEYLAEVHAEEVAGRSLSGATATISHEFKLPGHYRVEVSYGRSSQVTFVRCAYARREVRDLAKADWDKYVEAMWTIALLPSELGQERFACPNFYNLNVFTTMHGVNSMNRTCDQAYPEVGIKSLLDSEIVGPAYYGGGKANYDDRDPYDPYYVEDGRFARFPLRANRTGLCEESRPLFDDAYVDHCKSIMEGEGVYTFRGPANSSGIWMVEPRSDDSYEYVSRRSFYGYANEAGVGDIALPHLIPTYEVLAMATSMPLLTEAASYIMNDPVHGYAHYTLSGLWGGGLDSSTMCRADALGPAPIPLMEVIKDPSRYAVFAWYNHIIGRENGCFTCDRDGCTRTSDADEKGCADLNFETPQWSEFAEVDPITGYANFWHLHLNQFNNGMWMKEIFYGMSGRALGNDKIFMPNTGTFGRHPWANQDPLFLAHHAFTFVAWDLAMKNIRDKGISQPPLYDLEEFIRQRGVDECPGHNPDDATATAVYRNLVRYRSGQTPGSRQTWRDIMTMWAPDRKDYEWIVKDPYLTDLELLANSPDCNEACEDSASIISTFPPFPDLDLTPTQMCQATIQNLVGSGMTGRQACDTRLNAISNQTFFLADFLTVENSCEMSCRFCTFVCANSGPRPGQLAAVNDRDEGLSQALEERIEKYLASGQHKSRGGLV